MVAAAAFSLTEVLASAGLVLFGAVLTAAFQAASTRRTRELAHRQEVQARAEERIHELEEAQARQGVALAELRGQLIGRPPAGQPERRGWRPTGWPEAERADG